LAELEIDPGADEENHEGKDEAQEELSNAA
jgi:hypothetical protein